MPDPIREAFEKWWTTGFVPAFPKSTRETHDCVFAAGWDAALEKAAERLEKRAAQSRIDGYQDQADIEVRAADAVRKLKEDGK